MAETIGALVATSAVASGTAAAATAGTSLAVGATSLGVAAGAGTAAATGAGLFSAGNLALGSTLLSGITSIVGGLSQKSAYNQQAQMYANDAEEMRRSAAVEETMRLKRLNSMLDTNKAVAAAKGYDADGSPSFTALQKENESEGLADANAAKLNTLSKAYRMEWQGNISEGQGTSAMLGGIAQAGGSLMRYAASRR